MRIRDIIEQHKKIEWLEAVNIIADALFMSKEGILVNLDQDVDEKTCLHINDLLSKRERGMPLAYITKSKEFFSEKFYVDAGVLIPRPETELLVEEALKLITENKRINNLLDIGTGAGTIGLILAKKTQKHVVCTDISFDAIRIAMRNAENLGVRGLIHFVCADLFSGICGSKFDMILANLPYVGSGEMDSLMADVKNYEPRLALDGGAGGIQIYRRLIEEVPHHLKDNGYVLCEVGGYVQANKISEMLRALGMNTAVKKDLSGHDRVLIGSWTSS
ncbi:MAG TPA: peptide chain release factor N(5)-glutamine methyltransferase [Syntrophorhabdus sp.]|nr:peptide chain release factor N(5)-glutamine methyltransferase [Syntrophorhabdus sp.]HOH25544.1 peptide chain release factor N(5)-glutamine methyltransferase [Syntrophorhabdus sp.]HPB37768.1 peptide chain release factor N(5)-glutamine methyltransferase [Syntrophorhabdus sp.]HPW36030.1 peptide chain release factor N(5)-glutamine methyltransferase [Syntrophorhabdus sp.]HQB34667.1 peptide chain release factor N(5)-glutamine methyltransferase [Syntrophorhabdus sp.]